MINNLTQKTKSVPSFSAIRIHYNDTTFYLTVVPSTILFDTSKVSPADKDKEQEYQRLLGSKRARDIASYLLAGYVIPGAIILSAQKEAHLQFEPKNNRLTYSLAPNSFIVIDGQHRLYGIHQSGLEIPLAVCILENLDLEQELQYLLDINSTQRGLPRALQLELTQLAAKPESKEEVCQRLFNELNERPESPLSGRMSATTSTPDQLSLPTFRGALDAVLETVLFKQMSFDEKLKLLINFLSAIEDVLLESEGHSNRLTHPAFYQALFRAFGDISEFVIIKFGHYQQEAFFDIVQPIGHIDWEPYQSTNPQVISELTEEIKTQVATRAALREGLF